MCTMCNRYQLGYPGIWLCISCISWLRSTFPHEKRVFFAKTWENKVYCLWGENTKNDRHTQPGLMYIYCIYWESFANMVFATCSLKNIYISISYINMYTLMTVMKTSGVLWQATTSNRWVVFPCWSSIHGNLSGSNRHATLLPQEIRPFYSANFKRSTVRKKNPQES